MDPSDFPSRAQVGSLTLQSYLPVVQECLRPQLGASRRPEPERGFKQAQQARNTLFCGFLRRFHTWFCGFLSKPELMKERVLGLGSAIGPTKAY